MQILQRGRTSLGVVGEGEASATAGTVAVERDHGGWTGCRRLQTCLIGSTISTNPTIPRTPAVPYLCTVMNMQHLYSQLVGVAKLLQIKMPLPPLRRLVISPSYFLFFCPSQHETAGPFERVIPAEILPCLLQNIFQIDLCLTYRTVLPTRQS